ncbi:hypothetical protein G6F35_010970 [Rhizopus arrhizus]|nr:hypothetical protein G6F35_010970 [Rhizopus arrhizus]
MAADVLRQGIHDQRRTHRRGAEHPRRGQRVVHDVDQVLLAADLADDGQVGNLRARVGDRLGKDHARVGLDCGAHLGRVRRVHEGDLHAQFKQRAQQAVGVAEHELAGHQVVAPAQQRREDGRQRGHPRGEADRALAAFHVVDLGFQRRGGGRTLARVREARLALEHRSQLARVVIGELRRRMHGLVHRSVLDGLLAVGMEDRGGKAVLVHDGLTRKGRATNKSGRAKSGLALAHGLVQADGAGHADVQAFHRTQHGDVHQLVAGFPRQAAHALAFRAHDPRHRLARIDLVHAVGRLVVGADQPDAAVLQAAHRARQIGDHHIRHGVGSTAGHALDRGVQAHGTVARRDHGVHAGGVRRSAAAAGPRSRRARHPRPPPAGVRRPGPPRPDGGCRATGRPGAPSAPDAGGSPPFRLAR